MFGCQNCQCSSSLESIDLPTPVPAGHRYDASARRAKHTKSNEPQSYRKLRISSFIPDPPLPTALQHTDSTACTHPKNTLIPVQREQRTIAETTQTLQQPPLQQQSQPDQTSLPQSHQQTQQSVLDHSNEINSVKLPAQPMTKLSPNCSLTHYSSPSRFVSSNLKPIPRIPENCEMDKMNIVPNDPRSKVLFEAHELNQVDLNRLNRSNRPAERESLLTRSNSVQQSSSRTANTNTRSIVNNGVITKHNSNNYSRPINSYNFDYNLYSIKKNIGQGLIDIALLAANSNQLKNIITTGVPQVRQSIGYDGRLTVNYWPVYVYWINLGLVGLSIGLQVLVGILLLFNSKSSSKRASRPKRNAECYNNTILIFVLFITMINVFLVIFVDELDVQQKPSDMPYHSPLSPRPNDNRNHSMRTDWTPNKNPADQEQSIVPPSKKSPRIASSIESNYENTESTSPQSIDQIEQTKPNSAKESKTNQSTDSDFPSSKKEKFPTNVTESLSTETTLSLQSTTTTSTFLTDESTTFANDTSLTTPGVQPTKVEPNEMNEIEKSSSHDTYPDDDDDGGGVPTKQEIKEPIVKPIVNLPVKSIESSASYDLITIQPIYRLPIEKLLATPTPPVPSNHFDFNFPPRMANASTSGRSITASNAKPTPNPRKKDSIRSIEPHKPFEYTPQFWPPLPASSQTLRPTLSNYWTTFDTNS